MKLYYMPGACSLSPHIVLRETGLPFDLAKVDRASKTTSDGENYLTVNPRGYVPSLRLDSGEVLTEASIIVQYLADQVPAKKLAPPAGTMERYRLQEWLNLIASEIHKGFSPLFNAAISEQSKSVLKERLVQRLGYVNDVLAGRPYLMGDQFTVADVYFFVMTSWTARTRIDLDPLPHVQAHYALLRQRPAVRAAIEAEGLKI
ncbi:MAG: glutathione transferase GstA [Xanthobacteraceae bacterium]|nr:MAG: glutathione transferase GstA [Xanthobacteraceae bacterium]